VPQTGENTLKETPVSPSILEAGLRRLGEDPGVDLLLKGRFEAILDLCGRYLAEIELFNPAYGLVGAKTREELVIRHILDSLAPLGIFRRLLSGVPEAPIRAADVGSGAGLPGIPLAICLGDYHFTLIERMGRRAGFLRNTVAVLGLGNVTVEETEMEKAAPGRFHLAVSRAFRPLEAAVLKGLFRLVRSGGVIAAYKGRRDKAAEELARLGGEQGAEILPLTVPFLDEERCLALLYQGAYLSPR
jgi:16S rRNA (guanine527-N7)-methyltransferase